MGIASAGFLLCNSAHCFRDTRVYNAGYAICHLPVMDLLLECPNLEGIRRKYFPADVSSLRNLFNESVDSQNIIDFIKETHFYTFFTLTLMFVIHSLL